MTASDAPSSRRVETAGAQLSDRARARVLVIARELPWPPRSGGSHRILHFILGLARRHDVGVLALAADEIPQERLAEFRKVSGCIGVWTFDRADLRPCAGEWDRPTTFLRRLLTSPFPSYVHDFWSNNLLKRLRQLRDEGFTVAVTKHAPFAEQARVAGFETVVLDADDIFGVMMFQELRVAGWYKRKPLHFLNALKARRYERSWPRRFQRVAIANPDDEQWFPQEMRNRLVTVPNGVNVPAIVDHSREIPNRILFIGTLSYPPNHDAVCYFARDVLPRLWKACPDATVDIVGRGPVPDDMRALLTDRRCRIIESPPTIEEFYNAASLVVAPIRRGLGTRIKVIEALAHAKALVATSFAPEGLGLIAGTHYVAADTPDAFARACADLLADAPRRRALAVAGRAYASERFDWRAIERSIAELVPEPT